MACVHKFAINNGEVKYSNRLLESLAYKKTLKDERLYPSFGTAATESNIFERVSNLIKTKDHRDNTNVNVVPYSKDHLYAMTEITRISRLDPSDLSIMNTVNMANILPDLKSMIAHPHVETDGSWINCGTSNIKGKMYYTVVKHKVRDCKSAGEQVEVLAQIPCTHSNGFGYFHSFGVKILFKLRICFKEIL